MSVCVVHAAIGLDCLSVHKDCVCLYSGQGWTVPSEYGMLQQMPMHRFDRPQYGTFPSMALQHDMLLEFVSFSFTFRILAFVFLGLLYLLVMFPSV